MGGKQNAGMRCLSDKDQIGTRELGNAVIYEIACIPLSEKKSRL
jgi:hypothetical protein